MMRAYRINIGVIEEKFVDIAARLAMRSDLVLTGGNSAEHGPGWDLLLPGHGTIALNQAAADVSKALRLVRHCVANGTPVPALPSLLTATAG